MCVLIYSIHSHRKVVHHTSCKILRRIPKESRRQFGSLEKAQAHGYRLCNCCPSMAVQYRRERKPVKEFCKENGFTIRLLDGILPVISKHDCRRIVVKGKDNHLFLYHKNTDNKYRRESYPSAIPGYFLPAGSLSEV